MSRSGQGPAFIKYLLCPTTKPSFGTEAASQCHNREDRLKSGLSFKDSLVFITFLTHDSLGQLMGESSDFTGDTSVKQSSEKA